MGWVFMEREGWMSELFSLPNFILLSLAEPLKNTFSTTSDRRKSAGFTRTSSGTFLVLSWGAKKESDNRTRTTPVETRAVQILKPTGNKRTSQKSAKGKRRNR